MYFAFSGPKGCGKRTLLRRPRDWWGVREGREKLNLAGWMVYVMLMLADFWSIFLVKLVSWVKGSDRMVHSLLWADLFQQPKFAVLQVQQYYDFFFWEITEKSFKELPQSAQSKEHKKLKRKSGNNHYFDLFSYLSKVKFQKKH